MHLLIVIPAKAEIQCFKTLIDSLSLFSQCLPLKLGK
jgi:hypothetical protein